MYTLALYNVATPYATGSKQQLLLCECVHKYLLHSLVWLQCNVGHSSIQHEGEEIENQVGRSVIARKKRHEVAESVRHLASLHSPPEGEEGVVTVLPKLLVLWTGSTTHCFHLQ